MSAHTEQLVIIESVDSTNNYAMAQLHSGTARHLDAWFALEQTAGKGRRGKQWEAEKGQNIIFTIVLNTHFLRLHQQFQISVLASLSCVDMLHSYAKNCVKIKWPNDLYFGDRKAGGILIESIISGTNWQWAVIGIGLNINQDTFYNQTNHPVSLKEITGKTFDVIKLGEQLYYNIIERFDALKRNDFTRMLDEYNSLLYKRNELIRLRKQRTIFTTTVAGVSPSGQLQTVDSMERNFDFDEVEWIL